MQRNKFTSKILENKNFRTTVVAVIGFAINVGYVLFQGITGIISQSVWYITIAIYYLVLIIIKSVVIFYGSKCKDDINKQIKVYRFCGIMLNFLTFALSGIIVLVNMKNNYFEYADMMIFVVAIYTFYKIIVSAVQMFKARKQDNLIIQSIRNINLSNALYSILVLQVAMFQAFGNTNDKIFNAVTGAVVAVLIFAISISMITKSIKLSKSQKEIKYEN